MIYPSADTIEDRVGSRYSLVVLAAKRAKQIKEGSPVLIETASTNPLTIALEEIAAGKVTVAPASEAVAELGDDHDTTEIPNPSGSPIHGGADAGSPDSGSGNELHAGDTVTE